MDAGDVLFGDLGLVEVGIDGDYLLEVLEGGIEIGGIIGGQGLMHVGQPQIEMRVGILLIVGERFLAGHDGGIVLFGLILTVADGEIRQAAQVFPDVFRAGGSARGDETR